MSSSTTSEWPLTGLRNFAAVCWPHVATFHAARPEPTANWPWRPALRVPLGPWGRRCPRIVWRSLFPVTAWFARADNLVAIPHQPAQHSNDGCWNWKKTGVSNPIAARALPHRKLLYLSKIVQFGAPGRQERARIIQWFRGKCLTAVPVALSPGCGSLSSFPAPTPQNSLKARTAGMLTDSDNMWKIERRDDGAVVVRVPSRARATVRFPTPCLRSARAIRSTSTGTNACATWKTGSREGKPVAGSRRQAAKAWNGYFSVQ